MKYNKLTQNGAYMAEKHAATIDRLLIEAGEQPDKWGLDYIDPIDGDIIVAQITPHWTTPGAPDDGLRKKACYNPITGKIRFFDTKEYRTAVRKSVVIEEAYTTQQAADKWGVSRKTVLAWIARAKLPQAIKMGRDWLIPKDTPKPTDRRYK